MNDNHIVNVYAMTVTVTVTVTLSPL